MASGDPHKPGSTLKVSSPGASRRVRRFGARLQLFGERLLARELLWAVIFVVVLAPLLSHQQCGLPAPTYAVGEVTPSTIKAPFDIEVPDEAATRELRETERLRVRPVYDLVVSLPAEQRQKLAELFERGRIALRGAVTEEADRMARLQSALGPAVPTAALPALAQRGFSLDTQEAALRIHAAISQGRIVNNREALPEAGPIAVREVRPGSTLEAEFVRLDQIRDLSQARVELRERIERELAAWPPSHRSALADLLGVHIVSNLSYNASETERRRTLAMASVPQVFVRIPKGRVIVREGEVFTQEAIEILDRLQGQTARAIDWKALAGNAIIISLLLLFLHRYVQAHQRLFRRVKNLYSLCLVVTFAVTLGAWVGIFIADAVAEQILIPPFNDPEAYYWALPISAGAMLVTLLANGRVATVCSAIIAVLFGMALGWDARAMVFGLLSSFAGIYGISKYERRTAIMKAGAWVGLVNAGVVLAIVFIQTGFSPASESLFRVAAAALGGVLVVPVVSFSLPILEWLFNVLTDIRLLELSNLDNPLLRQLSVQAPGTYNHSVIVGTLAEQAAEEIGAHALLCRVGAHYHDIGKMTKPDYFVENMREGSNRHDKLSPRMSSLIIASHVKEGLRLAEEYNLPRQIRDMIPQHHGTRLITYFYRKAKRKEDPDVPEIHESDYRYPGPRPQSRESAITMMADSVEAAARTVEDPTPAKFEEVINTVTNAIILDHQFDECDLTFSDLEKIRASFLKSLTAVHHHRIAYPGFEFDRSKPRAVEAE